MYIPKSYVVEDEQDLYDFIRANSFGLLVSTSGGAPEATHLPIVADSQNQRLYSHMARKNNQWKELDNKPVLAVFSGPHAYISAAWYGDVNSVPTWNYLSVHVYGVFKPIKEKPKAFSVMEQIVGFYERNSSNSWKLDKGNAVHQSLMEHIVVFEIRVERMEGVRKLNQHHPEAKQRNVIKALRERDDQNSREIATLMEENLERKKSSGQE